MAHIYIYIIILTCLINFFVYFPKNMLFKWYLNNNNTSSAIILKVIWRPADHVATTSPMGLTSDVFWVGAHDVSGKLAKILKNGTLPRRPHNVAIK